MKKAFVILIYLLLPAVTFGDNYYVDPVNGNDSWYGQHGDSQGDGLNGPWKTLSKVTNAGYVVNDGDDFYLICGGTWNGGERLRITLDGTSTNPTVVGAYYMSGGTEVIGVNGDGKPIIDGENTYPTTSFLGLVETDPGVSYVHIENLDVRNSLQRNFRIGNAATYNKIRWCKSTVSWNTGIKIERNATFAEIAYNEISKGGKVRMTSAFDGICATWSVGGISTYGNDTSIHHNWVYDIYSEGITTLAHRTVAKYNVIGDTISIGLYANGGTDQEFAYNIVYGTVDQALGVDEFGALLNCGHLDEQEDITGNGIGMTIEQFDYPDLIGAKLHHNVVINRRNGIIWYNSNIYGKQIYDMDAHNNLVIDCKYNYRLSNGAGDTLAAVNAGRVFNNISVVSHADSNHTFGTPAAPANWTSGYNVWYGGTAPASGIFNSHTDSTANPNLGRMLWRGVMTSVAAARTDLIMANLVPNDMLSGYNVGADYDDAINPSGTSFITADAADVSTPMVVVLANHNVYGWTRGPFISSGLPYIYGTYPTAQQPCGVTGFGGFTNEAATCKWDYSATTYATMSNTFANTGGTQHSQSISPTCGQVTSVNVICRDADTNDSQMVTINIDMAQGSVEPPPVTIGSGGIAVRRLGSGGLSIR